MRAILRRVPLGISLPLCTGTGTDRPSECFIRSWLPLTLSILNPARSRARTTLIPRTDGVGGTGGVYPNPIQATSNSSVISAGGSMSSRRSNKPARRSVNAASGVSPSPTAPTPGRKTALAHQTPSSSCSNTYGTCTVRLIRPTIADVTFLIKVLQLSPLDQHERPVRKSVPAVDDSACDYASSSVRLRVRFGSTGMPGPVFVEIVTFLT